MVGERSAKNAHAETDDGWFSSIVSAAPVMLWVSDASGNFAYVNDRWLQFTGRPPKEQLGTGWAVALHPDDAEEAMSAWRRRSADGHPFAVEYRMRRRDGEYRRLRFTAAPRFERGRFSGFAGTADDVTDHVMKRDLESAQSLYYALAETIPALVLTTSPEGEVIYCNHQLLEYCGTDVEGLRGERWVDYIHPEDVQAGRDEWLARVQTRNPFSTEYRIRRHDAAYRWHMTHTAPLRDAAGEIRAWMGVSVDVHDRREAEDEARRVAEELQRAAAAKDEFLGLVSHELRTPITTIYGNAQVLRRMEGQIDAESRSTAITDIERESVRLHQLIDNMFVLARLETGQCIDAEPLMLTRVVDRVAAEHRAHFPKRSVVVVDNVQGAPACGEQTWVEQVVRNLVINAEKYSPTVEQITVSLDRSEDCASVRVLDRGSGISSEEAEHIFDSFYRSPRWADRAPGAGIGLAVCKRLVEAQGGQIWALPREGGGSEVGFTLPLETED